MTALRVARLGLRSRVRSLAAIPLLVAVVAGVVLTLAGGARRTVTALDRLRGASLAADLFVQPYEADERLDQLRTNPDVEAVGQRAILFVRVAGTEPGLEGPPVGAAPVDAHYLVSVDRPRVLEGRMPDPADTAEIAITEQAADIYRVGVGDTLHIESLTPEQVERFVFGGEPVSSFEGPSLDVDVTGVIRTVDAAQRLNVDHLIFTPAFWAEQRGAIGGFDNLVQVRAREGVDLDVLRAHIRELWSDDDELFVGEVAPMAAPLVDLLRTQAMGLLVAATAVGVAGTVVVAQALRRSATGDDATLAAVGLTRRQRTVVAAAPLVAAVLAGALVAVVGAGLASRAFPTGLVTPIEPSPGMRLDGVVLFGGALIVIAIGSALATLVAFRTTRPPSPPAPPGLLWRLLSRGPAPAAAAAHLATRRGVPIRPAMAGAVVALTGVVAAAVFSASLDRVIDDPRRDGWLWDAEVGIGDALTDAEARAVASELAGRPNVEAVGLARLVQLPIAGEEVQVVGLEHVEGNIGFALLEGEPPVAPGQVALGPATAEALDASVGDRVGLVGADGMSHAFEMTGLVRFPNLADDTPAKGAVMQLDALAELLPENPVDGAPGFPTLLARWSTGTDAAAFQAELAEEFPLVAGYRPSNQLTNLREVRPVAPTVLAVLAGLGIAAVVHALAASVRRARRDLGVLAAVGFDRRQRANMIVAQSVGYLGGGLMIGIPLGLVVGRWTWRLLAGPLALADTPVVPGWLALVVPAAGAVALLSAALPAREAARLQPGSCLRVE